MKSLTVPVFVVLLAIAGTAHASVIYDNGASDHSTGYPSDPFIPVITADNFVLQAGANTITDIHWWGGGYPDINAITDAFTILIFGDSSGSPSGNPLYAIDGSATVRTPAGFNYSAIATAAIPEFEYSLDIDPLTLAAGTTYWLSIVNAGGSFWVWSVTGSGLDDLHVSAPNFAGPDPWNTTWFQQPDDAAFYLTGVVPEPATMTLLGLGTAGLVLRRRFFRSK